MSLTGEKEQMKLICEHTITQISGTEIQDTRRGGREEMKM